MGLAFGTLNRRSAIRRAPQPFGGGAVSFFVAAAPVRTRAFWRFAAEARAPVRLGGWSRSSGHFEEVVRAVAGEIPRRSAVAWMPSPWRISRAKPAVPASGQTAIGCHATAGNLRVLDEHDGRGPLRQPGCLAPEWKNQQGKAAAIFTPQGEQASGNSVSSPAIIPRSAAVSAAEQVESRRLSRANQRHPATGSRPRHLRIYTGLGIDQNGAVVATVQHLGAPSLHFNA